MAVSAAAHLGVYKEKPMNSHMLNYPAYVGWDVTGRCNHQCFYCYNYWRTNKASFPQRDENSYANIAEFIISHKPAVVIISGGEPLIVFEQIKKHIIRFFENGIYTRILTNGSLINKEIADFCNQYQVNLMVSFPSVDKDLFGEITNSPQNYSSVITGMDHLYQKGVSFSPNIVVSKKNLHDFATTAQWLIDRYHPQKLFISRVTRPANASDAFEQFSMDKHDLEKMFRICDYISEKHKTELSGCGGFPFCIFPSSKSFKMFGKRCGAGKNGYCIDMGGNVRACSRDSESLGNIFSEDFLAIRESLIRWGERSEIPTKCKNCGIADTCRGGCRMTNLDYLRNGKAVDCDADPERAPKRLPSKITWVSLWHRYSLHDGLKSVEHGDLIRVSYMHHITYLSSRLANYVLKNKKVSVIQAMLELHISLLSAKSLILQLIDAGLII